MNKYVKEMVKIALAGGALAAALTGCSHWNSDRTNCGEGAGTPKAANMCIDRACSNASGGGQSRL